jgi:hypothetical protein
MASTTATKTKVQRERERLQRILESDAKAAILQREKDLGLVRLHGLAGGWQCLYQPRLESELGGDWLRLTITEKHLRTGNNRTLIAHPLGRGSIEIRTEAHPLQPRKNRIVLGVDPTVLSPAATSLKAGPAECSCRDRTVRPG